VFLLVCCREFHKQKINKKRRIEHLPSDRDIMKEAYRLSRAGLINVTVQEYLPEGASVKFDENLNLRTHPFDCFFDRRVDKNS